MNKTRLEAFSDGEFAIVITLLVLNITLPDVAPYKLYDAMLLLIPKIISYIMSFFLVGLYWIGHHLYFNKVQRIDGYFIFLNLVLLLCISILPFPTGLLGKYPNQALPLVLYGVNLIITNLVSYLMLRHLYKNPYLTNDEFKHEFTKENFNKKHGALFIGFNMNFALAVILSFYIPELSYIMYIAALVFGLIVYTKRISKGIKEYQPKC